VLLVTPNAFLNAAFLNFPAPANRDPARGQNRSAKNSVRSIFSSSPMATTCTPLSSRVSARPHRRKKPGFLKGDIISGLDDKPATAFTLGQLRDTFGRTGETHDVKVLRAGKLTSIAVTVAVVSIDQRPL
jgi:S1-C subfamily serine protease